MTKFVVEFGNVGGIHIDNLIIEGAKTAAKLAASLVAVVTNECAHPSSDPKSWWVAYGHGRRTNRESWTNGKHFVAVSRLGSYEGSASATLWKGKQA